MKRITFYFLFAIVMSSCAKESQQTLIAKQDSFVSLESIRDYVGQKTKSDGANETVITTYGNINNTPLLYIVNYGDGDGWQILSSDSRTPAVLAEGETGLFSLEEGSPAVKVWMDCMATHMAAIRQSTDEQLKFSDAEIAAHRAAWEKEGGERVVPTSGGYWQTTTTYQEILVQERDHMTPHWDQDLPYNAYCPLQIGSSYQRAPAGCVAIAAAEVLYYLHNKLNVPAGMVDNGFCIGDVDSYSRAFSGNSTTTWSQMDTTYHSYGANAEALMIGYIGATINMHYWYLGNYYFSWALPDNIRTELFSLYGISCQQGDYNESPVKSNLEAEMPVIVTATDWMLPVDWNIHCFVIDGFRKTRLKYTHYHRWIPNPNPSNPHPIEFDPYYTFSYSDPEITAIKINWGWASQWHTNNPVNDGWYSLTADWTVTNGTTYSYNHNVNMIYNIATL